MRIYTNKRKWWKYSVGQRAQSKAWSGRCWYSEWQWVPGPAGPSGPQISQPGELAQQAGSSRGTDACAEQPHSHRSHPVHCPLNTWQSSSCTSSSKMLHQKHQKQTQLFCYKHATERGVHSSPGITSVPCRQCSERSLWNLHLQLSQRAPPVTASALALPGPDSVPEVCTWLWCSCLHLTSSIYKHAIQENEVNMKMGSGVSFASAAFVCSPFREALRSEHTALLHRSAQPCAGGPWHHCTVGLLCLQPVQWAH